MLQSIFDIPDLDPLLFIFQIYSWEYDEHYRLVPPRQVLPSAILGVRRGLSSVPPSVQAQAGPAMMQLQQLQQRRQQQQQQHQQQQQQHQQQRHQQQQQQQQRHQQQQQHQPQQPRPPPQHFPPVAGLVPVSSSAIGVQRLVGPGPQSAAVASQSPHPVASGLRLPGQHLMRPVQGSPPLAPYPGHPSTHGPAMPMASNHPPSTIGGLLQLPSGHMPTATTHSQLGQGAGAVRMWHTPSQPATHRLPQQPVLPATSHLGSASSHLGSMAGSAGFRHSPVSTAVQPGPPSLRSIQPATNPVPIAPRPAPATRTESLPTSSIPHLEQPRPPATPQPLVIAPIPSTDQQPQHAKACVSSSPRGEAALRAWIIKHEQMSPPRASSREAIFIDLVEEDEDIVESWQTELQLDSEEESEDVITGDTAVQEKTPSTVVVSSVPAAGDLEGTIVSLPDVPTGTNYQPQQQPAGHTDTSPHVLKVWQETQSKLDSKKGLIISPASSSPSVSQASATTASKPPSNTPVPPASSSPASPKQAASKDLDTTVAYEFDKLDDMLAKLQKNVTSSTSVVPTMAATPPLSTQCTPTVPDPLVPSPHTAPSMTPAASQPNGPSAPVSSTPARSPVPPSSQCGPVSQPVSAPSPVPPSSQCGPVSQPVSAPSPVPPSSQCGPVSQPVSAPSPVPPSSQCGPVSQPVSAPSPVPPSSQCGPVSQPVSAPSPVPPSSQCGPVSQPVSAPSPVPPSSQCGPVSQPVSAPSPVPSAQPLTPPSSTPQPTTCSSAPEAVTKQPLVAGPGSTGSRDVHKTSGHTSPQPPASSQEPAASDGAPCRVETETAESDADVEEPAVDLMMDLQAIMDGDDLQLHSAQVRQNDISMG